jgi:hypothetical protein
MEEEEAGGAEAAAGPTSAGGRKGDEGAAARGGGEIFAVEFLELRTVAARPRKTDDRFEWDFVGSFMRRIK